MADGCYTNFCEIVRIINSHNEDAVILMQTIYNPQTGYIGEAYQQGADRLWNMLVLSGVISMFACAIPVMFYKITEKRQAEMVAEIEARKNK